MSGVKGRSGRKTMRDEEKRFRIIDKAWALVEKKLDSQDADRYQVARDIVVKDVPSEVKGQGFAGDKRIIIIRPAGAIGDLGKRSEDNVASETRPISVS